MPERARGGDSQRGYPASKLALTPATLRPPCVLLSFVCRSIRMLSIVGAGGGVDSDALFCFKHARPCKEEQRAMLPSLEQGSTAQPSVTGSIGRVEFQSLPILRPCRRKNGEASLVKVKKRD